VAYRGIDVVRDIREDHQGAVSAAYAAKLASQYAHNITLSQTAKSAYEFANYFMQSVDFDAVLKAPFAKVLPEGERSFALTGTGKGQNFAVEYRKATVDDLQVAGMWSFAGDVRIREDKNPIPGEDRGFGVRSDMKLSSGDVSHRTMGRVVGGVLRVIDPTNLGMLTGPNNDANASLDAKAMNDLGTTLPNFHGMMEKYIKLTPGLRVDGTGDSAITDISAKGVVNLSQIRKNYPDFGKYLETLNDMIHIEFASRQELPGGLRVNEVTWNSGSRTFTLHAKTQGGKVIPFDKDGRPHPEAAFAPDNLESLNTNMISDMTATVLGLTIKVHGVTLSTSFKNGAVAEGEVRLQKLPPPVIEGRALGIIPASFLPGSIQTYAKKFSEGLLRGSKGAGTYAKINIDTRDPKNTLTSAVAGTEFIDNFFINFGVRVAQAYIWPNEKVLASGWKNFTDGADAFSKDMDRLAAAAPKNPG
jgi:hypothetical protein